MSVPPPNTQIGFLTKSIYFFMYSDWVRSPVRSTSHSAPLSENGVHMEAGASHWNQGSRNGLRTTGDASEYDIEAIYHDAGQTCDISVRLDKDVVLAQSPARKYQSDVVAGRLHCLDDVARPVLWNIHPSGNTIIIEKQHTRFLIGVTNSEEIIII